MVRGKLRNKVALIMPFKGKAVGPPQPGLTLNGKETIFMLKIEVADFQDKDAFALDLKTNRGGPRLRDTTGNSISIRLDSRSHSVVSRCLDYNSRPVGQDTPIRHGKRPRRAYPAVKPCRPCRVGRVAA